LAFAPLLTISVGLENTTARFVRAGFERNPAPIEPNWCGIYCSGGNKNRTGRGQTFYIEQEKFNLEIAL